MPENTNGGQSLAVQLADRRGRLVSRTPASRLLLLNRQLDQQPQVVGTRDNLVDLRGRQVDIGMRVERNRFSGPQRAVSLVENSEDDWRQPLVGAQVPLAVRSPASGDLGGEDRMLADQPLSGVLPGNNASQQVAGSNNQMLDLPEYALSGDSIELTCNHGMPVHRLYSVKWFKDLLEFYRFIPANRPRTKSSLFLPEVRIDLARSNSVSVYLRNVTHKTSGLYRCEVVSGKSQ